MRLIAYAAAIGSLAIGHAKAGSYTYTPLDVAGASVSVAAINDKNQAAGTTLAQSVEMGFLYTNGSFSNFTSPIPADGIVVARVNNHDLVAAYYYDPRFNEHAFTYSTTTQRYHRLSIAGATSLQPRAINTAGVVAGEAYFKGNQQGFVFKGRTATVLTPPGALNADADEINRGGTVVGTYYGSNNYQHGYTYRAGVYTVIDPPGSINTVATAIADDGSVGGAWTDSALAEHVFVLSGGVYSSFDIPGSVGFAVSALLPNGQVIGEWTDAGYQRHGFNRVGGTLYSIDLPGAVQTTIADVNHHGNFVVNTQDSNGIYHAFLATCPAGQAPCTQ